MPRRNYTKLPQKVIDKAVRRHLEGGEVGVDLAKEHKISTATFYVWVKKYKEALLESSRHGETSQDFERADKRTLIAELQQLRAENRRLRDKIVEVMLKSGEI
jgi:transposase-like protein